MEENEGIFWAWNIFYRPISNSITMSHSNSACTQNNRCWIVSPWGRGVKVITLGWCTCMRACVYVCCLNAQDLLLARELSLSHERKTAYLPCVLWRSTLFNCACAFRCPKKLCCPLQTLLKLGNRAEPTPLHVVGQTPSSPALLLPWQQPSSHIV